MNKNQIEMLRFIIKQEIEAAGTDGMEHGSWGWAEKRLDENWKAFQESFTEPDQQEYQSFDTIEELFEDLHADERLWLKKRLGKEDRKEQATWQGEPLDHENENDMRFKKCMEIINELEPGDLTELMGENFMKEFKRASQR